jgi:hypothetical protein
MFKINAMSQNATFLDLFWQISKSKEVGAKSPREGAKSPREGARRKGQEIKRSRRGVKIK